MARQAAEAEAAALRVGDLEAKVAKLKALSAAQATELATLRERAVVTDAALAQHINPPRWAKPKARAKHEAAALLILSDLHFEETVRPEEIQGHNAYNAAIAPLRIRSAFERSLRLLDPPPDGVSVVGGAIAINGDIVTGMIHPELVATNGAGPMQAIVDVTELLAAGIALWADILGQVDVFIEWGNHGRLTEKKQAKRAAVHNWDWLCGQMLAKHFRVDDRVTVHTTESPDLIFELFGTRFLLTHGDKGIGAAAGGGIGGIWPSIMRMLAKRSAQHQSMGTPWDVAILGHWHQFVSTAIGRQGFIINGTTKGADEWSVQMGFRPEPPSQTLAIVTPEHGVTSVRPIFVADRTAEGW